MILNLPRLFPEMSFCFGGRREVVGYLSANLFSLKIHTAKICIYYYEILFTRVEKQIIIFTNLFQIIPLLCKLVKF